MSKLIYCQMCQDTLVDTKVCVENALPYVDHIVLVDGGSRDDSIVYFRNWSNEEPKLNFYLHPWTDNFSGQRNNYLKHASQFASEGDLILVSDPDEWFEKEAWENMKDVGAYLKQVGHTAAGFQCRSVSMKGPKRVHESLDNYHKHLLYLFHPKMKYVGNPHETVVHPLGFRIVNTPFVYQHVKQQDVIWKRGARNAYVGGGGPNLHEKNSHWVRLKEAVKEVYGNLLSWHDFHNEMLRGNLDERIKQWMFSVKDETGWDGASEMREFYKTYFRLYHPEEEPEEFQGVHIE